METVKTTKVYVKLLEEGTDTARGTLAIELDNDSFKLLPTATYDPEDEIWEFLPGSIVRVRKTTDDKGSEILLAVEQVA